MERLLIEDDGDGGIITKGEFGSRRGFRGWNTERERESKERRERKKALCALEKGKSGRCNWGCGSTAMSATVGMDEEMCMSGARGNSMSLQNSKFSMSEKDTQKKAFWNIQRWI